MNFGLQEIVHTVGHVPSAIILVVSFSLFTYWLLILSPLAAWFSKEDVVAPFFSYAAVLFALFAAMIASDIWGRYKDAATSTAQEASAVQSLLMMAAYVDPADGEAIKRSVSKYVDLVVNDEWPAMRAMNSEKKEAASAALMEMSAVALNSLMGKPQAKSLEGKLQQAIDTIRTSRMIRLSYAFDPVQYGKWRALMLFGLLTLFSVGMCHARKPRAMKISLGITAVGILITVTVLSNHRSPYAGTDPVKPVLLKESLQLLEFKSNQPSKVVQ